MIKIIIIIIIIILIMRYQRTSEVAITLALLTWSRNDGK